MNVYHRRRDLGQILRRTLDDSVVVVSPDHPLLVRAADILIGKSGRMTAVFLPTSEERSSPDKLSARLILNRLALPSHTRCILVAEDADVKLAQRFKGDFSVTLSWEDRNEISKVARAPTAPGGHHDVPEETVARAQMDYSNGMQLMEIVARVSRRPFSSIFGEPARTIYPKEPLRQKSKSDGPPRRPPTRNEITVLDSKIPTVDYEGQGVDTPTVTGLIADQAVSRYVLDTGVPYKRGALPGLVIIEDWPDRRNDNEKLIHATAFSGWAFILNSQRDKLSEFARRIAERSSP
jgi:hypothetical protein